MSFRSILSTIWDNAQTLFPFLRNQIGELPEEYKRLVAVLELIRIEDYVPSNDWGIGRPVKDRFRIARAYIAKHILKITYTKELISRLKRDHQLRVICGWNAYSKIPSPATMSRAFKEFAAMKLPEVGHQAMVKGVYEGKLVMHVTCDSTVLEAREKAAKKEGTAEQRKKKANDRYVKEKRGELESRRQKQLKSETLQGMLNDLPTQCDIGMKKNAQGIATVWKGYKLHVAMADNCVCLGAILTSASLNDCEVAIPLATKANQVAHNLYDLMDSAYDVNEVKEHSKRLNHVPIIDQNPRGKVAKEEKEREKKAKRAVNIYSAEDQRYRLRFPQERFNAMFKDWFGGRNIVYKGNDKIFCHAMFGVLALTAVTLLKLVQ